MIDLSLSSLYVNKHIDLKNVVAKLILYPATLLKLFMVSRSFLVEFFKSFRYKIMSSANNG
jgi:hypothetical protein